MDNLQQQLKAIKQQFFAFRNGIIADAFRKVTNYEVIFGLQVPQLAAIAREIAPSMELAEALWADRKVRESRLLATYLFPVEEIGMEKALQLAREVQTNEEADMLAFRLLKRLPYAAALLQAMKADPAILPYTLQTLTNHLS